MHFMHFNFAYLVNITDFKPITAVLNASFQFAYIFQKIMYDAVRIVGQWVGPTKSRWQFVHKSDHLAVINCSHGYGIEASAMSVSAPQAAHKLMGRKGH